MRSTTPHQSPSSLTSDEDSPTTREVAPFLRTLRTLLTCESDQVIRWTPDGLAFEIVDMEALTATVLPQYFKHNKYSSFQRQLNYFHFKKWTKSLVNVCTFSNTHFTRDNPLLSLCITRKRSRKDPQSGADIARATSLARLPSFDESADNLLTEDDLEWLLHFERMDESCAAVHGAMPMTGDWTIMEL